MSRTITAVSNPFYSKADNSAVDCLVTFSDIGQHPYTSSASDDVPYGASLWASLQADTYGAIAPYVAPTPTPFSAATCCCSSLCWLCDELAETWHLNCHGIWPRWEKVFFIRGSR